jgi:hypothetical protein
MSPFPMSSAIVEIVSLFFPDFGKLRERLRRLVFNRKYGIDAYDAVHGQEVRAFLDREYGQHNWSWELKLLDFDRPNSVFEVRYDDCGAWAGIVAVAPHRPLEERFRIVRKEERPWPPPEDWIEPS